MRLSGGLFRGRELKEPHNGSTHPMGSRERLALFNSLSSLLDLHGLVVLDAYAGTGALGFEALSRGAAHVTFVEHNHVAADIIRQNIDLLHVKNTTKLVEKSVTQFIPDTVYNLILIDPPYDNFQPEQFIHLLQYLTPDGILVLSHPATFNPTQLCPSAIDLSPASDHLPASTSAIDSASATSLTLHSTKTYAAAHISIFIKNLVI